MTDKFYPDTTDYVLGAGRIWEDLRDEGLQRLDSYREFASAASVV